MSFERRLGLLGWIVLATLTLFSLRLVYWQLVRGIELQPVAINPILAAAEYAARDEEPIQPGEDPFQNLESLPQPVLQRTIALLNDITRGGIYDRNGRLLANEQIDDQGNRRRVYYDPTTAHVLGYTSALRTGLTGLEFSYNETLLGINRLDAQLGLALHQPVTGSDLILTLDQDLQQQAAAALVDSAGAIVVLDGKSGAVLALASSPTFDPNRVTEEGYAAGLLNNCNGQPACMAPFLNRATQGLYSPGSTFKTVTLIAALETGQVNPQTMFDFGEQRVGADGRPYYFYEVDGGVIPDPNHPENRLSLPMAYAKSANAAFARMGVEMNPADFIEYGQRMGFSSPDSRPVPSEIEYFPSQLANDVDELRTNNLLRGATAIGQGELLSTPLNLAMMVQTVINNGDLPMPYFVQAVRSPDGTLNERLPNRRVIRNLIKESTAKQVHSMMQVVVQVNAADIIVEGMTLGGKTGTAQLGGDAAPHVWFAGYGQKGDRSVVIVVLLEHMGAGRVYTIPVFAQLAASALK